MVTDVLPDVGPVALSALGPKNAGYNELESLDESRVSIAGFHIFLYILYILLFYYKYTRRLYEAVVAQGHKHVTVNATCCGFASY